jgi:hypothetical protein
MEIQIEIIIILKFDMNIKNFANAYYFVIADADSNLKALIKI